MNRLAIVALAATLGTLSACGSTPSAAPAPTTPTSATTTTTPPASSHVFGPTGYHGVTLRMTGAQVTAAGGTLSGSASATCREMALTGPGSTGGWVSRHLGAALLSTRTTGAATPEGIHPGATLAQVKAAYPGVRQAPDFWAVAVPGHPGSSYWFGFRNDHLGGLTLVLDDQNCVN
jgi:hypothetical protein